MVDYPTGVRRRREESTKLSSVSWRAPNRGDDAQPRAQGHGRADEAVLRQVDYFDEKGGKTDSFLEKSAKKT